MFVASVAFVITFIGVRVLVELIRVDVGPFNWVTVRGRHIHHLVFGIIILLAVGYGWLADIGTGEDDTSLLLSRLMAILYGVGAALTLDEFALWLNLQDVYWSPQGRSSIDAIVLFGALLSASSWGLPLLKRRPKKKLV